MTDHANADSSANMTTRESISNDVYGYLKHPSGLILPKVLRDQLQQSLKEKSEEKHSPEDTGSDTNYEETNLSRHQNKNKERYWNVSEIVDMINATSQKIQNIQTQIINGEDYYVNNVTSISVYNTKNNYSDSTTFLDSKTDSTSTSNYPSNSNTGGSTATNSYGMNSNSNQYRWFSSSFTNIKPYQQTMPYPIIPRKEKLAIPSLSSSASNDNTSKFAVAQSQPSTEVPSASETLPSVATTTATADANTTSKDGSTTVSKRGRSNNVQPQPPPTRRSTKRRRKT